MLVLTPAADSVEFDHCTFRRAHDAVQLGGDDVSIHHCLFEDVNDEVVQFNRTSNARVFKNLMRQVCTRSASPSNSPADPCSSTAT